MGEEPSNNEEKDMNWDELTPEQQETLRRYTGHLQARNNHLVFYSLVGVWGGAAAGALIGHLFHNDIVGAIGIVIGTVLGAIGGWRLGDYT